MCSAVSSPEQSYEGRQNMQLHAAWMLENIPGEVGRSPSRFQSLLDKLSFSLTFNELVPGI